MVYFSGAKAPILYVALRGRSCIGAALKDFVQIR